MFDKTFSNERIMLRLGQLARLVYPIDELPLPVVDAILRNPAKGFVDLLEGLNARDLTDGEQADLRTILRTMPPVEQLPAVVPSEARAQFWQGWYRYGIGFDNPKHWTPNDLARVGRMLFGSRWQTDLAAALDVSDRAVRAWASGERRISAGVREDIVALLREQTRDALEALEALDAVWEVRDEQL
ncbi:hypothetical protein [Xanthomonas phage XPP1]|uniref:Uncharacterized protein n=1 Tax=Xanthomonas phage XPP1 TaxID=2099853 RepID=A0A3S7I5Y8_9CAUD|nr:hypothetical protein KEM11_gp35 [Xanthomonas phage XPP1]AVO23732.1 hypothetical protein [Xanthomonas phage XPP2]AVO23809.1 hypothetical protein [Xanthomonas phage XPP3]AVO23899.1 hypothetical protein [Xanthomonas phage XPP4]AVO24008.1 hypothetical protein [Xanthomonas phage XPP6]AVO24013.1 hypothetical protein [Xanthomonas phage XPP8]